MLLKPKRLSTAVIIPLLLAGVLTLVSVTFLLNRHLTHLTVRLNTAFLAQKVKTTYYFCETALGKLIVTNSMVQPDKVTAQKDLTIFEIESFLLSEGLDGCVMQGETVLFSTVDISHLPELKEDKGKVTIETPTGTYYGISQYFPVWQWRLIVFMPESSYWATKKENNLFLGTIVALCLTCLLFAFFILRFGLLKPINILLAELHEHGRITYHTGTEELDMLSDAVNKAIDSLGESRRKLAESETKLSNILQNSTDFAIIATNLEDRIILFNPMAEKLLGCPAEKALNESVLKIHTREAVFLEKFEQAMTEIKDAGKYEFDLESDGKEDRKIVAHAIITPMRDDHGNHCGYVFIARDVTEIKNAENQLRQSQKMQAIGTLAGGVAHDFNNILGAILGYTELALLGLPADSARYQYLTSVKKAGSRAKNLVRQILAFSRQGEAQLKSVEIAPVIKEALKLLRASIPSTIKIQQDVCPEPCKIMADPTEIHQVAMNLCTNAFHAMESKGGVLTVTLATEEITSEATTESDDLQTGRYLKIMVGDTGHGMDKTTQEQIFEPFYTTKEKERGTGMGLAVVHGIVTRCNGVIRVWSEPGKGARFELYFPVVDTEPGGMKTDAVVSLPTGVERILLVDDEPELTAMGERMLAYLGYTVSSYTDSRKALDDFRAAPDDFDLLITDQTMPIMTGSDLGEEALKIRAGMPVIICTGYSAELTEKKAKEIGMSAYLWKPLTIHQLAETVRRVLDEDSGRS